MFVEIDWPVATDSTEDWSILSYDGLENGIKTVDFKSSVSHLREKTISYNSTNFAASIGITQRWRIDRRAKSWSRPIRWGHFDTCKADKKLTALSNGCGAIPKRRNESGCIFTWYTPQIFPIPGRSWRSFSTNSHISSDVFEFPFPGSFYKSWNPPRSSSSEFTCRDRNPWVSQVRMSYQEFQPTSFC